MNITEHNKNKIRNYTKMSLHNFYLDPITKLAALQKLSELGLDNNSKGVFSATIRALLSWFAACDDPDILADIKERINTEYVFTKSKNKRSKL